MQTRHATSNRLLPLIFIFSLLIPLSCKQESQVMASLVTFHIGDVKIIGAGLPPRRAAIGDVLCENDMITTGKESDENCGGTSATEFIVSSKPNKADPVDGYASIDDTTFYKVKPSTLVYFDIHFHNDFCHNSSPDPVVYKARIRVLGEGAFLSSREVQIIVPGSQAE